MTQAYSDPSRESPGAWMKQGDLAMATLRHIDTCLSCYLTDHHNRDGEMLLGVPVDGASRVWHVRDSLRDEFRSLAKEDAPKDAEFDAALRECFTGAQNFAAFDSSLERNTDEHDWDEPCYAWFLLSWDTEDAEDAED